MVRKKSIGVLNLQVHEACCKTYVRQKGINAKEGRLREKLQYPRDSMKQLILIMSCFTKLSLSRLLPITDVAKWHGLRNYLQIQQWEGNSLDRILWAAVSLSWIS